MLKYQDLKTIIKEAQTKKKEFRNFERQEITYN